MLYGFGFKLGLKSLFRGHLSKKTAALLVMPVNYWRVVEYALVFQELQPKATDTILDIGSPKLFSVFLANRYGLEIHPTDIEPYFLKEYAFHKTLIPESISNKIHPSVQDGRKLQFPDEKFDKVYSISVIEHIPDEGDGECLKEVARVLKPGGRCVLTIPFSPEARDEFQAGDFYWAGSSKSREDKLVFFQRRYDEDGIRKRLALPSGLKVVKVEYVGEKILTNSKKEFSSYLPYFLGPLHPVLAKLFLTTPTNDWKKLKKPLCALVVLEKE